MGARRGLSVAVAIMLLLAVAVVPAASTVLAQAPEEESPTQQVDDGGLVLSGDAGFAVDASLETEADLGSGFYYQGTLLESGAPVTGSRQMEFRLWDAASGGAAVGSTLTPTVAVNRGQFSVVLSWSGAFTGAARWLGVRAKDSGGTWRDLGRRQILAVPYATSLMPGATIDRASAGNTLTVLAHGSGYPLRAIAYGTGYDGVWGTGTNQGVYGDTTGTGASDAGVFGGALADSGYAKGGYFYSQMGIGVYGTSDTVEGVYGYSANHDGVTGRSSVAGRSGVYGYSVNGYGVSASSANGIGLNVWSDSTTGPDHAIYALSNSVSHGVLDNGAAVVGLQAGTSIASKTVFWMPAGLFMGQNGVVGMSTTPGGHGVAGWAAGASSQGAGVFGEATGSASNWAGRFYTDSSQGVYISAPAGHVGLNVASGTKNAVVATDEGARLLYTEESSEVWFTDYGFGTVVDGEAMVTIDPLFAQTVNLTEPYHVFVQANGPAVIYVASTGPDSFTVKALPDLGDQADNVQFSYRLVARRLGYEGDRLEAAPWADADPNLYPEAASALGTAGGLDSNGMPFVEGVTP